MFRWYAVNTYSGHENKVKQNLEHRVVSLGQQRNVRQIVIPTEHVSEMKDGQKIQIERRTMPGYVLVNMDLNEDSWSLVKGTPGVTGFVGAQQKPVPLSQMEIDRLLNRETAERNVRERIFDILLPDSRRPAARPAFVGAPATVVEDAPTETRDKLGRWLDEGKLDEREIEIDVKEQSFPSFEIFTPQGVEEMGVNVKDMLPGLFGGRSKKKKMRVGDAREIIVQEEAEKLVDQQNVAREAIERVEQSGIVFLDEIDKIAGRQHAAHGPDVSREGVQRDLLPIVEGTTVNTKYGMVKTDHILFVAAGAFHVAKPSDLIPELQGRFPIRVELESLTEDDFVRILHEPKNALTMQYSALLATEGVELTFADDAVREIARYAAMVNDKTENIGARRLHTILERLLDEVSFDASDMRGQQVTIDAAYVRRVLAETVKDEDLSRYVL